MALISRVRVVWTGVAGSPAYTNLYIARGTVSSASAQAAVASFMSTIRADVVSSCTITTEGDVAIVDSATDQIVGVDSGTSTVTSGTGGTTLAATANQGVIRWLTNTYLGGRQIRGRTYIPYLRAAAIGANGQLAAATVTNFNNAASTYITGLTGQACVFSRVNGVPVQITSYNTWNQVGIMRSRRD